MGTSHLTLFCTLFLLHCTFHFCSVSSLYFLQVSAYVVYCWVSPESIQGAVTRLQEIFGGPLWAQSCLCVETSWPEQDTLFPLCLWSTLLSCCVSGLLQFGIQTRASEIPQAEWSQDTWVLLRNYHLQFTNIWVFMLAMTIYLTLK